MEIQKVVYLPTDERFDNSANIASGDVHVHPGPVRNPCSVCTKPVASIHRAVQCDSCQKWCHIGNKCGNVNAQEYQRMVNSTQDFQWECSPCLIGNIQHEVPGSNVQQQQRLTNRPSSQTKYKQDEEFQYTNLAKELEQLGKAHLKVGRINVNGLMTMSKLLEIKMLLVTTKFDNTGNHRNKTYTRNKR